MQVVGRWFNEWEHALKLNVSKIVWSAKDQAEIIEADKRKKSFQQSSLFSPSLENDKYSETYQTGSNIATKGRDRNLSTQDGRTLKEGETVDSVDVEANRRNKVIVVVDSSVQFSNDNKLKNSKKVFLKSGGGREKSNKDFALRSRIPISVCALPCKVGEMKIISTVSTTFKNKNAYKACNTT